MTWHWLYTAWFGYTWPSLKGNGPEALVQTVVYALLAYLFIPPFRRWVNAHFKAQKKSSDDVHLKLDHIIKHHPDIPKFVHPDERPRSAGGKFTTKPKEST